MGKVLHASFSGWFPFCLYTGATGVGAGTMRPVGLDLESCMKLFWRVKKWRATFSAGGITLQNDFLNLSGQAGSRGAPDGYLPPSSESDIVCRRFSKASPPATFVGFEEILESSLKSLELGFFLGGATANDPLEPNTGTFNNIKNMVFHDTQNNLFYPIISIGATVSDQATFTSTIKSYPSGTPTTIQFIENEELWFEIPAWLSGSALGVPFSQKKIEPIEYWSYGETYDTTTGEPIGLTP